MKFLVFAFVTLVSCNVDQDFLQANKWFSASVFKRFAKNTKGNFVLSPFSVETVLALTHSGSNGQTADEIRRILNFTNDPLHVGTVFKNLLPSFRSNGKYKIHTANKIYVKDGFPIKQEFKRVAEENFEAEIENVDFNRSTEVALNINRWVEKQTNNTIHNLVEAASLNDKSRAVLVNALYFKANWSKPFLIAYNKMINFHLTPSEAVPVETMLLHEKPFKYYESPTLRAKFLELPFKGDNASMVIALPDEINGLEGLQNQMKMVLKTHPFSKRLINLSFPKFKIETSIDFKKILKNMGVKSIFNRTADLSGIAGEKGDLIVDKVAQKSFIDVSEEGVEASAATYTLIAIPMSGPAQVPKNFKIDRPFIFYIKVKEVIIFVGRVTDPRQ